MLTRTPPSERFRTASTALTGQVEPVGGKTFTGWKLDIQKAVRADHKTTLAASAVFGAFMDYVNQETCRAWPSLGALAINCDCTVKTVKKHLNVLVEAKWLVAVGKSNRGTIIYEVQDHRMNAVLDNMTMRIDRHREMEAERQANRRKQRQKA